MPGSLRHPLKKDMTCQLRTLDTLFSPPRTNLMMKGLDHSPHGRRRKAGRQCTLRHYNLLSTETHLLRKQEVSKSAVRADTTQSTLLS